MKSAFVLICGLSAAGVAIAQPPAPPPPAVRAAPTILTNAPSLWAELRGIQAKLHPIEENLEKNDPEIKSLVQLRADAQQVLLDLDTKRRALIAARLQADPATALLAKRRAELLAKAQAMRSAGVSVPRGDEDLLLRLELPAPSAPAKAP